MVGDGNGALNGDPKTMLNQFCQKYCKKVISKADVVYEMVKFGDQYQATLTLHCIQGAQFAGEPATNQKQAEQNAASIALENYAAEIATLPASTSKNSKKRKAADGPAAGGGGPVAANTGGGDPSNNSRCLLNSALMKILARPCTKEDMSKTSVSTAAGYQCTLTIPSLPGEWAGMAWAGEAAPNMKDAEESAATYAIEALRQDPTFAPLIDQAQAAAGAKKAKTAAAAPQGGDNGWAIQPKMPKIQPVGMVQPGDASGVDVQAWMGGGSWGKGKGKDKGKGKGKGKANMGPKVREPVSETAIFGKVVDWKGKYGWIEPLEAVEHPMATKNKGKIFLHTKDWANSGTQPTVGQDCQFTLYSDHSGLGAENAIGF